MSDSIVLVLFLATWGGMVLLFRRLTDDFRRATVRQSEQSAEQAGTPAVDEELLRITAEVQETVEGLGEALTRRAEHLRTLIAEADSRIAALAAQPRPITPAAHAAVPEPAPPPPVATAAAPQRQPEPVAPPPVGQGVDDVRRLAAEGHDVDTIARLTKRGREEVRILLRRSN